MFTNKFYRNKVICDFHFKENNFMNYKRERLTKTIAVPTIYIEPETNAEVDLLENPTDWVEENKKKSECTTYKQPDDINMDEQTNSANSSIVEENTSIEQPLRKKIKSEFFAPVVRILNGRGNLREDGSFQQVFKKLPTAKQSSPLVVKLSPDSFTIRKFVKPEITAIPAIPKQPVIECFEEEFATIEPPITSKSTATAKSEQPRSEELKPVLEESIRQLAEIKEMIKKQAEAPSPSSRKDSEDNINISQSQLNKVQLFNGIKRYLSPSISALLRMELFAAPGREYKKDEKIICQELLQLGEKTYSFLHDEWRLRLPAKAEVQQWLDEKETDEDDDAS